MQIRLGGAGLDLDNDKLKLDVALDLNTYPPTATHRTIGGVTGVSYNYDPDTRTIGINKSSGTALTGAQVKAIVESLALINASPKDGERTIEVRLIKSGVGELKGPYSSATLIVDTQAPSLDLDYAAAGLQIRSDRTVSLERLAGATGLFEKTIGVAATNDIRDIRLEYTGRDYTRTSDRLFYTGAEAASNLLRASGDATLNLPGLPSLRYTTRETTDGLPASAIRSDVVIKTASGAALTNADVRTLLEGLRFKSDSRDTTDRLFKFTLTDMAGNSSTQTLTSLWVDISRTAPALTASLVDTGKQISYGMVTMTTGMGSTHTSNLSKGESVKIPLPTGFTADNFLLALKAIASDWGGPGITAPSNVIDDKYRSYTSIAAPSMLSDSFSVAHQSHRAVKGNQVQFSIAGNTLSFINNGGFAVPDSDIYRFTRFTGESKELNGSYEMGNLRLLYQTTTDNVNSTPTFAISYDRAKVSVGDVIGLYEGNKLLASKTLESTDVGGSGTATLNLKISDSLASGNHAIFSKYTSATGLTSQSRATTVNITGDAKAPLLTDLKVKAGYGEESTAKAILLGGDAYTSITDPGRIGGEGTYDKGLIFSGSVNTPGLTGPQKYLVTVSLGGKLLGYDTFTLSTTDDPATSKFTLQAASNLLAPGLYRDLTATVTNVTEGSIHNGQTSAIKDASLGWYWVGQGMGNLIGGNGNDGMLLGASQTATPFTVTTGAGADTLTLGAFGKSSNLTATVTDFQLGLDKVQVWAKSITSADLSSFVTSAVASDGGRSTTLTVDLDGVKGGLSYTLQLQNVAFNTANTQTIFGV
ncbi:hypothetical protein [Herbaspirillum camelliae]|uniref:hypothetical protein n=1 Tax=Herbaspirillum camelliae TaxID=1892903 RepID=UPI000949D819|nr:hypothetical protein [Herbaspirillum camelliae]